MPQTKKAARIVITLSSHLKRKLEMTAQKFGCSQAEVVRLALVRLMEAERGV